MKQKIDEDLIMPDKSKSIMDGGLLVLSFDSNILSTQVFTVASHYNIDLNKTIKDLKREELDIILYGSNHVLEFKYKSKTGNTRTKKDFYEGVITNLERRYIETKSSWISLRLLALP